MRVLVISNDVVPGFGVPVAAPGLRSAGIAEGLRAHGHEVIVSVPSGVIDAVLPDGTSPAPTGVEIVNPTTLMAHIRSNAVDAVMFSNANMTPHLQPLDGVHFVFDMFAPKLLESLASPTPSRPWQEEALEKERGLALADEVWVNGQRKVGYALGWLVRPAVDAIRQAGFAKSSLVDDTLLDKIHVVEMPVPLPTGVTVTDTQIGTAPRRRLGIAGYAQQWSALPEVHPAHDALVGAGHELHALLPAHWGAAADQNRPTSRLPEATIMHDGPLLYDDFCRWVQSMDVMVDVFAASPERRFAMITRSAVALRLGVPLLHGVDSEISDIVREYDAGWVLDPNDIAGWRAAAEELADSAVLAHKRAGAVRASEERFMPSAALSAVARRLHDRSA